MNVSCPFVLLLLSNDCSCKTPRLYNSKHPELRIQGQIDRIRLLRINRVRPVKVAAMYYFIAIFKEFLLLILLRIFEGFWIWIRVLRLSPDKITRIQIRKSGPQHTFTYCLSGATVASKNKTQRQVCYCFGPNKENSLFVELTVLRGKCYFL